MLSFFSFSCSILQIWRELGGYSFSVWRSFHLNFISGSYHLCWILLILWIFHLDSKRSIQMFDGGSVFLSLIITISFFIVELQEEIVSASGQVEPPGMHIIYLPYSDDIRPIEEVIVLPLDHWVSWWKLYH